MRIVSEYLKSRTRFFDHGRSPHERAARSARVISFLEFAAGHVFRIRDLRQNHYDEFIQRLQREGLSSETIYKYRLAIKEFACRARLPMNVKTSRKSMKTKKLEKILAGLDAANLSDHQLSMIKELIWRNL